LESLYFFWEKLNCIGFFGGGRLFFRLGCGFVEIYVQLKKRAEIVQRDVVFLEDVAEVFAEGGLKGRVERLSLLKKLSAGSYIISAIDVVAAVSAALPGAVVSNLGEMDVLIVVKKRARSSAAWWTWAKVAFVCLVLFAGSATAIMAFHSEAQLGTVFKKFYEMFFGHEVEKPYIITIPYSVGLSLGIMVFFNHFAGRRFTKEPTPIEVEMEKYESDADDAVIQSLSRQEDSEK